MKKRRKKQQTPVDPPKLGIVVPPEKRSMDDLTAAERKEAVDKIFRPLALLLLEAATKPPDANGDG
jgi:hypothetical protein